MDPVEQLRLELSRRIGVLGLIGPIDLLGHALSFLNNGATSTVELLCDPERGPKAAEDVTKALWPLPESPAPIGWWFTPLGLLIADTGFDPGGDMSKAEAGRILGGWTAAKTQHVFGKGRPTVRAVLDVHGQPSGD